MLKSKIHQATVTEANIQYVGSITIDTELLEAADILPNEKVQVVDMDNGVRLETYVIPGERGSGTICLNGAAARLIQKGNKVIVLSYILIEEERIAELTPKILHLDEHNRLVGVNKHGAPDDIC
jgi:aspartate 1-decarboxylase